MTHEELVKVLDQMELYDWVYMPMVDALRSVIELHKPIEGNEHLCSGCWFGDGMMAYPCPTIQAIEKELG